MAALCHFIVLRIVLCSVLLSATQHFVRPAAESRALNNSTELDNTTGPANNPSQCFNEELNNKLCTLKNTVDENVIRLLSFFSCAPVMLTANNSDKVLDGHWHHCDQIHSDVIDWQAVLGECDLLAYVAAELAQERINVDRERSDFDSKWQWAKLELVPIEIGGHELSVPKSNHDPINSVTIKLIQHLTVAQKCYQLSPAFHGVLGPGRMEDTISKRLTPLFANIKWPQVSYGGADSTLQDYHIYHQTLPNEIAVNNVRLNILENFYWPKFGILSIEIYPYNEAAEGFEGLYWTTYGIHYSLDVAYSDRIVLHHTITDIKSKLKSMKELGIRIIFGFFGPKEARDILCIASHLEFGLTSSEHVWILPSYYDPDWWKSGQLTVDGSIMTDEYECSDEEMVQILNSAISVDAVKYPTLDLSVEEFYSDLIVKTRRLFPSLRDVDLSRYLQHSRATSAYDAVMLLYTVLNEAYYDSTRTKHDDTNPSERALQLLTKTMACEQCRLWMHFNCINNYVSENLASSCQNFSGVSCNNVTEVDNVELESETIELILSNSEYGQVMVSQFVNGSHCPLLLCWPQSNIKSYNFTSCSEVSTLNNLTCFESTSSSTAGEAFFPNSQRPDHDLSLCPTTFWWKGRSSPPDGNVRIVNSYIPVASLVVVSMTIAFGLLVAIVDILFNIILRNNVHIKATSPRLNLVIVFGCIIQMPIPLLYGLNLSSLEYNIPVQAVKVFCWLVQMVPVIGSTLIVATLFVKNWRIYYVFHKKTPITENAMFLTDNFLLVFIFLLTIPTLLAVIVYSVWIRMRFRSWKTFRNFDSTTDFTLVNITNCETKSDWKEDFVTVGLVYVLFLWFFDVVLAIQNGRKSTTSIKRFRMESKLSLNVATVAAVPFPIFIIGLIILLSLQPKPSNYLLPPPYQGIYWLLYCWLCVCPLVVLIVPLTVRIVLVLRSRVGNKLCTDSQRSAETFCKLKAEASTLREQLSKKEDAIKTMQRDKANTDNVLTDI